MAFNFDFEELKRKAAALGQSGLNMAQTGVDMSIQLAAIAKLKAANVKEESDLRSAFAELGKMYFADHGAEPEEAYAAVCSQIGSIQATIAANNAKIAEIKIANEAETEVEVEVETPADSDEVASAEVPVADEAPEAEAAESAAEEDSDYGFTN